MNINEEWLDKYQKNRKEINQLFKDEDQNKSQLRALTFKIIA